MTSADELPPWLHGAWQALLERHATGRLPHALLLQGQAGIGKHRLASRLARRLLCTAVDVAEEPCGECRGCRLVLSGAHPDWRRAEPDPEKRRPNIPVDAIRALIGFVSLSSQYGGCRVAVIGLGDAMNAAAANSLLKTLEEPPGECFLILVTARPARLPATLRSRCQRVDLRPPAEADALAWLRERVEAPEALLALAGGAPYAALALAGEQKAAGRLQQMTGTLDGLRSGTLSAEEAGAKWAEHGGNVTGTTLQRVVTALLSTGARAQA